jgi:YtxH-like protein
MMSLRDLKKLDRDDLLDWVGLQRSGSNDWVVPALTALGVGLLVGAGLGLLLAPKPGAELRDDLRDRLRNAQDALPERLRSAATKAESVNRSP